MKKLFIFDLDGTLLNTLSDLAAATNQALAQLGFPTHEEKAYLHFVGYGIFKLFERALPPQERTQQQVQRMQELFVPYYNAHGADLTRPYPGISEVLAQLQQRGIQLAVASNKYQAATSQLISHYFPNIHFAAVLGQRDGLPTKPDPLLVQEILAAAQVVAADTLYVGDSDVDMQTAHNSGVDACGVLWGFRAKEELAAYAPRYLISKPEELIPLI